MKSILTALTGTALLALAGPVQAQVYAPREPMLPQPEAPYYQTAFPTWQMDDRSSSDFPIHMPGDISGERLNMQYRDGITVPPGEGFPAPYFER